MADKPLIHWKTWVKDGNSMCGGSDGALTEVLEDVTCPSCVGIMCDAYDDLDAADYHDGGDDPIVVDAK